MATHASMVTGVLQESVWTVRGVRLVVSSALTCVYSGSTHAEFTEFRPIAGIK